MHTKRAMKSGGSDLQSAMLILVCTLGLFASPGLADAQDAGFTALDSAVLRPGTNEVRVEHQSEML